VSSGPPPTILDTSSSAPLETVRAIDSAAALLQLVPGANIGASVVPAEIAAGRADAGEAGLQLAGVIPGGSWFRKAETAVDAATGVQRARQIGLAGERAAGITGPKRAISVDGKNLFPDDITIRVLTEVKNVKRLSFTRQLKDYNKYTRSNNLKFVLVTRPGTKLSGPLLQRLEMPLESENKLDEASTYC